MIILFGKQIEGRTTLLLIVFIGSLLIVSWNIYYYYRFHIPLFNVNTIIGLFLLLYSGSKLFLKKFSR